MELEASTITGSAVREELGEARIPGLTLLFHPEGSRIGERVALPALTSGRRVEISRLEPLFTAPGDGRARPLADPHLSRSGLVLTPLSGTGELRLERGEVRTPVEADGTELGAGVSFSQEAIERGVTLVLAERVALLLHLIEISPEGPEDNLGLIGESAAMARLRQQIRRVAPHAVPVLLRGETGTGKELVARAIHRGGPRCDRPSISINMGAIPPSLAAAELFGASRGAYTGAVRQQMGYFRKADGGTLFLDEVGETPPEVQVLLLRALETGEVQPVGTADPIAVDVRMVAATDADLEAGVAEGRFRAPLLHRLGGYEIRLPALRERREDIGRLFFYFLRRELLEIGASDKLDPVEPRQKPWLPPALVARLARYGWPGNVRQLRNVARQLAIAGADARWTELERLTAELLRDVDPAPRSTAPPVPPVPPPSKAPRSYRQPYEISDEELLEALRENGWRLKTAAAALGVSRTSLYTLIDRCPRIRRASELVREEIEGCRERHGGDLDAMAQELQVSRYGLQHRMRELKI